jgi:hypothetical protein
MAFSFRTSVNDVDLPAGSFTTLLHAGRVNVSFSPDLSWASLVQYDSVSQTLALQSRVRWIQKPGNDVFFTVNHGWIRDLDGAFQSQTPQVSVKLQYTIRL